VATLPSVGYLFERYSRFVKSHSRVFLALWVLLLIFGAPLTLHLPSIVSYSINVPSSNRESAYAENLVSHDFRGYQPSNATYYVLIVTRDALSPSVYKRFLQFNKTLYQTLKPYGLSNISSVYSLELSLLTSLVNQSIFVLNETRALVNSTYHAESSLSANLSKINSLVYSLASNLTKLDGQIRNFTALVYSISQSEHALFENITVLNQKLYLIRNETISAINQVNLVASQINATNQRVYALYYQIGGYSRFVYEAPYLFVSSWLAYYSNNPNYTLSQLDFLANRSVYSLTNSLFDNPSLVSYYNLFLGVWSNLTQSLTTKQVAQQAFEIANRAVYLSLSVFLKSVPQQVASLLALVAQWFNITDYTNTQLQASLTLSVATQNLTQQQAQFVQACFELGANPSAQAIDQLALSIVTKDLPPSQASFVRSAFYEVPKEGIENFTLNYLSNVINQTQPALASFVYRNFGVTLYTFLSRTYSLGFPASYDGTRNLTLQLVSHALPKNITEQLLRVNLTAQAFLQQVFALGYPPNNQSVTSYALNVFGDALKNKFANASEVVNYAYLLGSNPSRALALDYSISILSPSFSNLTQSEFALSAQRFLTLVAKLGNPPSDSSLKNVTLYLVNRSFWVNHTSFVSNFSSRFNQSFYSFLSSLYQANEVQQKALYLNLSFDAIYYTLSQDPLLQVNKTSLLTVLQSLNTTKNARAFANALLSKMGFARAPVSPSVGLLYQLIDPSKSATIVTLQFSHEPSNNGTKAFESVVERFNTSDFVTYYTAGPIISKDLQGIVATSERVAIPVGLIAAVVITGAFFLSPIAAVIPTLVFALSMTLGFGLVYLVIGRIEGQTLSYISPVVIALLGLGLATDYSVLIMNRFRQELSKGEKEAVRLSVRWAGEAVFTSGLTVVLSYVALDLAHIPLFSDVGLANVLVVSSVLLCTLTLLPAILALLGKRVFWPKSKIENKPSVLSSITKKAISHPKSVLGALVAVTLLTAVIAVNLPVNINFLGLTPNTPAKVGLDQITQHFGGSTLIPTYVVVELPSKISTAPDSFNTSELEQLANLTNIIRGFPGVRAVYGVTTPYNYSIPYETMSNMSLEQRLAYSKQILQYVSFDNSTVYFKVVFNGDAFDNRVLKEARTLSEKLAQHTPAGYHIYVGGASLDAQDVLDYIFRILPELVGVLIAAIYVVLFVQLKSAFTPLRLIATIMSSIAWTLFLVWLIFYKLSGLSVFIFAPLFLITTMLGVGMDYDIFMIVRVREEAGKGSGDELALIKTSETTAGVITALGLILATVFLSLGLTPIVLLRQIGLTLALGVLLDTFVVWLVFVPSIMVLAKRLNWWPGDPRKDVSTDLQKP